MPSRMWSGSGLGSRIQLFFAIGVLPCDRSDNIKVLRGERCEKRKRKKRKKGDIMVVETHNVHRTIQSTNEIKENIQPAYDPLVIMDECRT